MAGTLLAIVLFGGGLAAEGLVGDPGGVPASAAGAAPSASRTVVARPGDTLWAMAYRHHGSADVDRYLDELVELNGGTELLAGQLVRLP